MKSLHKKIGVVVLAGALLVSGAFASSKIDAYAYDISIIYELSYNLNFEVIKYNYNGGNEGSILDYFDANEFIYRHEKEELRKGIYVVNFEGRKVLVRIP